MLKVLKGKRNAFKYLNLILVNHQTLRWFEVKFNLARSSILQEDTDFQSESTSRIYFSLHNSFNYSDVEERRYNSVVLIRYLTV